ncbi:hypothetical protein BpHYR1_042699 [Brachionus plicatilis]|uniref:Uncharacterized protein n=1 Tax=Brachionus plicatilis TaxID=10195 RepID=A0A3M7SAU0_BRAPC|nr:hypothetical protein BpHYR1_042699 [Brachionus plicatilis]
MCKEHDGTTYIAFCRMERTNRHREAVELMTANNYHYNYDNIINVPQNIHFHEVEDIEEIPNLAMDHTIFNTDKLKAKFKPLPKHESIYQNLEKDYVAFRKNPEKNQ